MSTRIANQDIWELFDDNSFIVVPTNISVKANGNAVMGRGIAAQAVQKYPNLPKLYGKAIIEGKTINGFYVFPKYRIVTVAVKKHWKQDADIVLIESQLELLKRSTEKMNYETLLMPLIGCGFGRLTYEQILPLLLKYSFDGMVVVVPPNELYASEDYRASFLPAISGKRDRRVSMSNCYSDIEI